MDITRIYHEINHNPEEYSKCLKTNAKSFVDDNFLVTKVKTNQTLEESVMETMTQVETYMNANRLALNPDKTKIMIMSKNEKTKKDFNVTIGGKLIIHKSSLKVLGNIITDDLSWNKHVEKEVIPQLAKPS